MAVRPLTTSAPVAKRSGKAAAPKNTAKSATRKSDPLPEGADESDDIDFGDDAPAAPSKPARTKGKAAPAPVKAAAVKAGKSKMAKGDIELTFSFVKDTGGTYQYREVGADGEILPMSTAVMGGAYLRKSMVTGELPKTFTVTVHLG